MGSINPHIKINKLLEYSKKLSLKNKNLPKVIIIFNDNSFDKKKFSVLKIPKNSAFLFRSYNVNDRKKIAKQLLKFCRMKELKLLISSDIKMAKEIKADGIHFPEYMISKNNKINWKNLNLLKLKYNWIITTAAHNKTTLNKAISHNIDAALLSPVFQTKSHSSKLFLGVIKFTEWVKKTKIPIYALGGINIKNIKYLENSGMIGFAFQRG